MAEWPIAAVLKTAVGQPTVGSNPTSSDPFVLLHLEWGARVAIYESSYRLRSCSSVTAKVTVLACRASKSSSDALNTKKAPSAVEC